ncbi:hypothetical protein [Ferroglobus placidus]|nr:hypothetical protein [Ferroglobus placidus]
MPDWHKAKICMPCHINTLTGKDLEKFLTCTPCHNTKLNLRDQRQIEELHGVDVCIKCHVGSEYDKRNLGIHVHDPHYKLSCSTCHGDVASKPETNLCTECHGSNPHAVHSRVLDEICTACHGEKIKDYIPPTEEKKVSAEKIEKVEVKEERGIIQSISDLILNLLSFIF